MMAERYRGDLQDATLEDVIDEAGQRWDCREITGRLRGRPARARRVPGPSRRAHARAAACGHPEVEGRS